METCKHCGDDLREGDEVIYEGYSGDYFCNIEEYRKFVRDNLDDYFSYIQYVMNVGRTTL